MTFFKSTSIIFKLLMLRNGQFFSLAYISHLKNEQTNLNYDLHNSSKAYDVGSRNDTSHSPCISLVYTNMAGNEGVTVQQKKGNGLLLYFNNYSFYAQKVCLYFQ